VEVTPSLVNVRAQLTFHELDHLLQPFVESAKGTEGEDGMRDGDLAAHMPPPPPLTGTYPHQRHWKDGTRGSLDPLLRHIPPTQMLRPFCLLI
jgi:hypothetical protein